MHIVFAAAVSNCSGKIVLLPAKLRVFDESLQPFIQRYMYVSAQETTVHAACHVWLNPSATMHFTKYEYVYEPLCALQTMQLLV